MITTCAIRIYNENDQRHYWHIEVRNTETGETYVRDYLASAISKDGAIADLIALVTT